MEDKNENVKYRRLVDDIRRKIDTGHYKKGDKLTSENRLVEEYGYSRQTIRQALSVLENEGLLVRRRGSGTYIDKDSSPNEKTYNVGVLATYLSDYIFPLIIRGIEEVLSPRDYHISLAVTRNKIEEENRVLRSFLDRRVDGIIVEGTKSAFPNPNLDLYRRLQHMGIPVVFFNGYYGDLENTVYVVTDDRRAGFDLTAYLVSRGCRRIGGMFKSDDMQGHRRYSGYVSALMGADLPVNDDSLMWYTTADEMRFGQDEFDSFVAKRFMSCDGIICYNDNIAAALLSIFAKAGRAVPGDIMLGSFDNSKIAEYPGMRLTSMNHPKEELGRVAAHKLLRLMDRELPQASVRMPMQLVIRNSTR